ncbi:MAG TPA: protein translocase subunit SecD [Gaiellaceae bacterium]|nr:protein translocase subunit SecD [Gaiellaceae bacterium]
MGLIFVALVGVALLGVPGSPIHKKPTLGLDLQGGLEVVKKAVPDKGQKVDKQGLDDAVTIINDRINGTGVSEPEIRKQGSDQIVIELPGVKDQKRAAELIGQTAKLELYDLQGDLVPGVSIDISDNPTPRTSVFDLLSTQQQVAKKGEPSSFYLVKTTKKAKSPTTGRVVVGPTQTRAQILSSGWVKRHGKKGELPKGTEVLEVPEHMVVITCNKHERYCPGVGQAPDRTYFYLFKYDPTNKEHPIPEMTGSDLKRKGTKADFDTRTNEPIVLMDFTKSGGNKFQDITRTLVERGRSLASQNGLPGGSGNDAANQQFAIVLDREMKSAPSVDFDDNPNGIPGNNGAQITGISIGDAKDLALVLRSGTLPFKLVTIEQTNISATLGKDSLQQAKKAAIGGLLVVALFLLLFYRFLGLVAVLGLGIYAAFLYAAVLLFNVTLSLPGFAGLILTIGVAADANVVVFERIKEEFRAGKSVRAAISAGYSKGFHTIIDANVVTAITAMILFLVATAGVKGFALMLLIGTVISLITAFAATRAMLGLLAGFRWFDNPRFMGAQGQQGAKWLQIDFMAKRYLWFAISGAVVVIAIASLGLRGLNLGIDFKGGTQVTFNTPQPQLVEDVRTDAKAIDPSFGKAIIQGRGASTGGKYKSFQLREKSINVALGSKLRDGLEAKLGATHYGAKNVSESFGRQIARSAILAIIFSLFLIVLYLAIRFDLKYAIPVIAALIHDIVITVGVYSLTGREVSTSTVAAVLTVLGYSIYDTIIIFDRIRENVPLMRRSPFATIANISLWETIRRSLATTFITLLPVGSLLFFGGATLKDFAFALLIGIGSGAYSSIFIAAPILTILKEREPEYARKIGQDDLGDEPGPDGGSPARRRPRSPIGGPAVDTGTIALEAAEQAAAAEPAPSIADGLLPEPAPAGSASAKAKRERRRQRRRTKPHGRR